jgi:CubicO group peptidase (beta-lactamase class C family)
MLWATMHVRRVFFPVLLICALLALILRHFGTRAAAQAGADRRAYAAIDAYVEEQMRRLNIPGVSLAVVEGDRITHLRGFGQARPQGEAPSPQTPFVLGSTTKSFTALVVMQLVEAGKIELDAPVQHYLPWFRVAEPAASAKITVRHLLNQTSGLPGTAGMIALTNLDASPGTAERQARALSGQRLNCPVGAAFEYSNWNYNLLGLVIEAVSGEAYTDYVQHHIFDALEMRHSYTARAEAQRNGLAVGHRYWFTRRQAMPDQQIPQGSLPTGGLISSAEDMGHYLIALLNGGAYGHGQILSPEGIATLHHAAVPAIAAGIDMGHYGMGWFISETDQTEIVWHAGNLPDFSSYMALLPEARKGLVLLVNADHYGFPPIITEVGEGATALLAGRQPAPPALGFMPWVMRALLLIPLLQLAGVWATVQRSRRWRSDPARRPGPGRLWGVHILLPLIPNLLLVALPASLLASGLMRFTRLYAPDLSWIALLSGGFAGIWAVLRTGLLLSIFLPVGAIIRERT